jgi:RHS repeat-associated protein
LLHKATRLFDGLNRLTKITDANTGVSQFAYDKHDRPLTATDPDTLATTYVYDGFGDMIQQASPDAGTTVYHYDGDRNLTSKTDAAGVVTNYTHDKLDRRLTTTYPADSTLNVAYTYDQTGTGFAFGISRLTSLTDASGSLSRSHDERGNILTEKRINGTNTLTTTYTYDAASRVASITYPSGAQVSYTRDNMGKVYAMPFAASGTDETAVIYGASYEPFGPVTAINFNSGDTDNYTYDLDYRATGITSNLFTYKENLAYGYDAADNLHTITDAITPANTQTLGYDVLNRLKSATSGTGGYGSLTWNYDKNGNLTTSTAGGTTFTYGLATGTNRLSTITRPSNSESFGYTATGNINSETLNSVNVFTAAYSKANRLASVTGVPLAISSATYDAFGKRITKTNPASNPILYSYDLDGNVIEENNTGVITDYIYVAGRLVGNWRPAEHHLFFVHTDRMGTPIAATDEFDQTDWSATYIPYGVTQTLVQSGFAGNVTNSVRFPGQFFDHETGFHQNGFRDYVPNLGRYLESDPIGLAGGLNRYRYANANPGTFTDRNGTGPNKVGWAVLCWLGFCNIDHDPEIDINPPTTKSMPANKTPDMGKWSPENPKPESTGTKCPPETSPMTQAPIDTPGWGILDLLDYFLRNPLIYIDPGYQSPLLPRIEDGKETA